MDLRLPTGVSWELLAPGHGTTEFDIPGYKKERARVG